MADSFSKKENFKKKQQKLKEKVWKKCLLMLMSLVD